MLSSGRFNLSFDPIAKYFPFKYSSRRLIKQSKLAPTTPSSSIFSRKYIYWKLKTYPISLSLVNTRVCPFHLASLKFEDSYSVKYHYIHPNTRITLTRNRCKEACWVLSGQLKQCKWRMWQRRQQKTSQFTVSSDIYGSVAHHLWSKNDYNPSLIIIIL